MAQDRKHERTIGEGKRRVYPRGNEVTESWICEPVTLHRPPERVFAFNVSQGLVRSGASRLELVCWAGLKSRAHFPWLAAALCWQDHLGLLANQMALIPPIGQRGLDLSLTLSCIRAVTLRPGSGSTSILKRWSSRMARNPLRP